MKKYKSLFLIWIFTLIISCNYLDVEPGDTITENRFWSTANGVALEQYCHTYYARLVIGHGDPNSWDQSPMLSGDLQSDNLLETGVNQVGVWQNVKNHSDGAWNWSIIRGCNAFWKIICVLQHQQVIKTLCGRNLFFQGVGLF